jgi:hypothetical protein
MKNPCAGGESATNPIHPAISGRAMQELASGEPTTAAFREEPNTKDLRKETVPRDCGQRQGEATEESANRDGEAADAAMAEFRRVGPSGIMSVLSEPGEGEVWVDWRGPDGSPIRFRSCSSIGSHRPANVEVTS